MTQQQRGVILNCYKQFTFKQFFEDHSSWHNPTAIKRVLRGIENTAWMPSGGRYLDSCASLFGLGMIGKLPHHCQQFFANPQLWLLHCCLHCQWNREEDSEHSLLNTDNCANRHMQAQFFHCCQMCSNWTSKNAPSSCKNAKDVFNYSCCPG